MGSRGRMPPPPPHMRHPLPDPNMAHPDAFGPGMRQQLGGFPRDEFPGMRQPPGAFPRDEFMPGMRQPPGAFPPFDMPPHPEILEQKLSAQHNEMQKLLNENQRLARTHGTLRQELAAAQHELQMLHSQIGGLKTEREQQMRALVDKIGRMEADLQAAEPVKSELAKVRADAQSLVVARQELISKAQKLTHDIHKAHAEAQILPALMSELESVRQEYHHCRATYDYEKKLYSDHLESLQAMEKNYVDMAREVEKLQAELNNTNSADRRTGGPYGGTGYNEKEIAAQYPPAGQKTSEDIHGVPQGQVLPAGGTAVATAGVPPVQAGAQGSMPPKGPAYDAQRGPTYDPQTGTYYDPQRAYGYGAPQVGAGYEQQRGPGFDPQRAAAGYDLQRAHGYEAQWAAGYEAQRAAANPQGQVAPSAYPAAMAPNRAGTLVGQLASPSTIWSHGRWIGRRRHLALRISSCSLCLIASCPLGLVTMCSLQIITSSCPLRIKAWSSLLFIASSYLWCTIAVSSLRIVVGPCLGIICRSSLSIICRSFGRHRSLSTSLYRRNPRSSNSGSTSGKDLALYPTEYT